MASISSCTKADEEDLIWQLTPVIRVRDEKDTVAELIEWPLLKGSRVEYPTDSSRFREFSKAKSIIDGIWGHAFSYRGNFFRTCSIIQGGDYLHLLPYLAKEKKCRRLGDEVSLEWAASGSEMRITAKDFLEYYAVKYVTATDGAYLSSSSSRPCFFDLSFAGQVQNDNLLWVSGINCKVSRMEFFIDVVALEGTELEAILKELEITRFKRVASKGDKLAQLNEIPDGPVDMATVSYTVVRNLAKRKAIKWGAAPRSVTSASVDDSSKRRMETSPTKSQEFARTLRDVQLGFQDRLMEREKRISQLEGEKNQLEENLTRERGAFQLEWEKEREVVTLKLKEVRAESEAEVERLVTASAISQNNLTGKLYQLRYKKAEIMAFSEGNYEEMKIMDEEEVEEREDGLNVAKKTAADNQEIIKQEIASLRLRVVDLEGLLEVENKSSAELQYEDRLDDNMKLSLKLEEAKGQVEEKTATILSRDLALNQLTSELAEMKEKAASGSRHEAELAEYRVRAINEEISDMKYRVKADLPRLKGRKAQSRADVAEIQAKNKILVDDLAHACGNKDLKLELDKRDSEIAYDEGSREMKEFLCQKEELVENMHIDLKNSRQKSIDLTRHMSECNNQLTAELAESKTHHLKDNKRTAVTHQAFKERVVQEQEKCDGEALHQQQLSTLVAFFVEEIKILQVERDLM
ncbi:hypothetical protein GIB67_035626 [Kingdonia uniflora]|uniref:Uncharacterized protein n=1 Tax=Kingdonia uniflora TaxID=39325 RepID=A0A7J7LKY5_9MAGN|nr:hypothetical protein GIB67_035626 [Kingdonia uniflora]